MEVKSKYAVFLFSGAHNGKEEDVGLLELDLQKLTTAPSSPTPPLYHSHPHFYPKSYLYPNPFLLPHTFTFTPPLHLTLYFLPPTPSLTPTFTFNPFLSTLYPYSYLHLYPNPFLSNLTLTPIFTPNPFLSTLTLTPIFTPDLFLSTPLPLPPIP